MADGFTGLGYTLKEHRLQSGDVTVSDACRRASERLRGAVRDEIELGSLELVDGYVRNNDTGEVLFKTDEYAVSLFSKLLNIPLPYLSRLGIKMQEININYWLQNYHDKVVEFTYRDEEIIDIREGTEIDKGDILDILDRVVPGGSIIRTSNQTNAVIWDVIDERQCFESKRAKWIPGIRVVVKEGLNAPEIAPIFVNEDSCGTIECAEYFEKLNIKSLGYSDILHVVGERMCDCINSFGHLFESYRKIETEHVPDARKRIALYCRENSVSDRVREYAVTAYEDSPNQRGDFGDIVSVFTSMCMSDAVKPSSERKLQKLAGHIITKSRMESRCDKCDSLELEQ